MRSHSAPYEGLLVASAADIVHQGFPRRVVFALQQKIIWTQLDRFAMCVNGMPGKSRA